MPLQLLIEGPHVSPCATFWHVTCALLELTLDPRPAFMAHPLYPARLDDAPRVHDARISLLTAYCSLSLLSKAESFRAQHTLVF